MLCVECDCNGFGIACHNQTGMCYCDDYGVSGEHCTKFVHIVFTYCTAGLAYTCAYSPTHMYARTPMHTCKHAYTYCSFVLPSSPLGGVDTPRARMCIALGLCHGDQAEPGVPWVGLQVNNEDTLLLCVCIIRCLRDGA